VDTALVNARYASLFEPEDASAEWIEVEALAGGDLSRLHRAIYLRHPWLGDVHPDHVRLEVRNSNITRSAGVSVLVHRDHLPVGHDAPLAELTG
jgi:hypothetical protein